VPRHYPGGNNGPRHPWRRAVLHALFVGLSALGLFLALDRDSDRADESLLAASNSLEPAELALTSLAAEETSVGPDAGAPPTVYARDEAIELARVAKEQLRPVSVTIRVQEGDTVAKLARAFNVSAESIIANNPGIIDADSLRAGQEITVPGADGIFTQSGSKTH
jgi:LysM repeat protein